MKCKGKEALGKAGRLFDTIKNAFNGETKMQAIKAAGEKIKQAYIKANADAKNKFKEILFDVDKKLAGSRAHIKSMIEAKEKRIDEMNEQLSTLDNEIKKAQKDHNEAQERRAEFEKTKMNEKGEIISDFEEPC